MFLILGLGNPGPRYDLTRHNAGFLALDNLADRYKIKLTQHKYRSLYGKGEIEGLPVILAKPMTYMNESGKAVKALLSAFNLSPEQILVTHDDIDLPLGKIKTKLKGGDGGQLGVRSTIEILRTREFYRVRIGVGRPEDREDIVDYVLSPFTEEESGLLNDVMNKAVQTIEAALTELNKQNNPTED
ncbi:MAG TPA: aminoacyl-tRNA hydrolase [Nitrospinae bacterium]|nr:aminoacyl-tRNA hydrolase [Nitrospinota bacterium]